ncbi:putative O-methyltransferase YrrM [Pontibacter ummariensis]|uniref:Predicted O-methyltransferase YrrM n=1 Tax=Pontibacter ummariensis TaxID=1610492 RepID=A0A239IIF6_9BACT|nr:class I SAM-dependent methyltransferase [Pontibacter ummariensis]PRY09867.1 putative O-methyltransferase YrrM [Pontibacter ummariensis]SNS93440.1 Predicted O-methyltransferase YrrM [Pontibacter ummariensis]
MKKVGFYVDNLVKRVLNYGKFKNSFLKRLPQQFHGAAKLLYYHTFTEEEKKLASEIERFRSQIPALSTAKEIYSYTSPHSNTFKTDEEGKALPGEYTGNSVEAHMKTGSSTFHGILLRRIVAGAGVKRILELGTNTGFSGCYFLSVPGTELVTIEGSAALCEIAKLNMDRISDKHRIMNMLFDEAIDVLLKEKASFDCVFIDGQHEQKATLHYTQRVLPLLKPGALIVHDDIYWSEDMHQAWQKMVQDPTFSQTVDLFYKGVCVLGDGPKAHYDMGECLPRPEVFRKNW